MSDMERLDFLSGILIEAATMIKDLTEEVHEYREVDREEKLLNDLAKALGEELANG